MSYTPPAGDSAHFSWVGVAAYTPPAGDAAHFSWVPPGFTATGEGTLEFAGAGAVAHGVSVAGAGALPFTGAGAVEHSAPGMAASGEGTLAFTGAGASSHGISTSGAGALSFSGAGTAGHGIALVGAGSLNFTGSGAALQARYEVRGEVRLGGGMLVNRRVRCYKRSSGELVGQVDTVAGLYRVPAGFDDGEVYVTAIDLDESASDWIPPTANRLVPILASDTA